MHFPDSPVAAKLGTVAGRPEHRDGHGDRASCGWTRSRRTRSLGATEVWEFYNGTGDAHPMHVHEVQFQVVNRQARRVRRGDGCLPGRAGSVPATT